MSDQVPAIETLPIAEVAQHLQELVERVHRRDISVSIEVDGVPAAAIVSAGDRARLRQIDEAERETRREQWRLNRWVVWARKVRERKEKA